MEIINKFDKDLGKMKDELNGCVMSEVIILSRKKKIFLIKSNKRVH